MSGKPGVGPEDVLRPEDLQWDLEVSLFATGWFFPLATSELPRWPQEGELLLSVDWFLDRWRSRRPEGVAREVPPDLAP